MSLSSQESEILGKTNEVLGLLYEDQSIKAMTEYLADDVQLSEGNRFINSINL